MQLSALIRCLFRTTAEARNLDHRTQMCVHLRRTDRRSMTEVIIHRMYSIEASSMSAVSYLAIPTVEKSVYYLAECHACCLPWSITRSARHYISEHPISYQTAVNDIDREFVGDLTGSGGLTTTNWQRTSCGRICCCEFCDRVYNIRRLSANVHLTGWPLASEWDTHKRHHAELDGPLTFPSNSSKACRAVFFEQWLLTAGRKERWSTCLLYSSMQLRAYRRQTSIQESQLLL